MIDRAADRTICGVLDDHYDSAGDVLFHPAHLIHNHRDLLDFELHCTSAAPTFAADGTAPRRGWLWSLGLRTDACTCAAPAAAGDVSHVGFGDTGTAR